MSGEAPVAREAWITGIGVVSAWGVGLEANLAAWKAGKPLAGSLDDAALDRALAGLPDERLRHADRVGRLAVAAARLALEDARLPPPYTDVALSLGVGFGTYAVNAAHQRRILREGVRFASPAEFTLTLPNITTSFVSMVFGIRGETTTFCDSALAGASALGHALDLVRSGGSPVLAGGGESWDEDVSSALRITTPNCGAPADVAALLVLEDPAEAARRGAPPRGRLVEYHSSSLWRLGTDQQSGRQARGFIETVIHEHLGMDPASQLADLPWPSGELRHVLHRTSGGAGSALEVALTIAAGTRPASVWRSFARRTDDVSAQWSSLTLASLDPA